MYTLIITCIPISETLERGEGMGTTNAVSGCLGWYIMEIFLLPIFQFFHVYLGRTLVLLKVRRNK